MKSKLHEVSWNKGLVSAEEAEILEKFKSLYNPY